MANPERRIFIPLGDKYRPDLEKAAFDEAWEVSREILEEGYSKGRILVSSIESLQRLPFVNSIYYLKKGIVAMGGYLVTIEEKKMPRKDFRKGKILPNLL